MVLVEHALLDNLIYARRGERQPGCKTALNLREVHGHDIHELVNGLLACYHHPNAAAAVVAELLHEGLKVEHTARITVEVLAHLIDHEHQAETLTALRLPLLSILIDVIDKLAKVNERGV